MMFVIMVLGASLGLAISAEILARAWARRQSAFVHRRWLRTRMFLNNGTVPGLDAVINCEYNEEGERGDPLPKDRDGLYRVLVVGGSAAECGLLDQSRTWPAVLQGLFNHAGSLKVLGARQAHVGNVGRSLTPARCVGEILEHILPRYDKLDLLILMVGVSDAVDWLERGTPVDCGEDSTGLFGEDPREEFHWRPGHSALRRVGATLWRRFMRPVRVKPDFGVRLAQLRLRRQRATEWIDKVPDPTPMLDKLDHHLCRSIRLAQSKGIRVLVARQPWFDKVLAPEENAVMWNFCRGRLSAGDTSTAYYTHATVRNLLDKMDRRLERVCRELGVEQVDLRQSVKPGLTNFYDFLHFTPAGAQRVAGAVFEAVLAPQHHSDLAKLAAGAGAGRSPVASAVHDNTAIMVRSS